MYKLKDFIPLDKIIWKQLSKNRNAVFLLENNLDKIDWQYLSSNKNTIHLIIYIIK
jgi:hypothetical protein